MVADRQMREVGKKGVLGTKNPACIRGVMNGGVEVRVVPDTRGNQHRHFVLLPKQRLRLRAPVRIGAQQSRECEHANAATQAPSRH